MEATDDEIFDLHARTEHGLQATSKKGSYLKYRDVLGEEVREAGRRWGFDPSPSEVEALPGSVRYWLPFPDTVNALRALQGRYRLAIISNIDDALFALTARYLEVGVAVLGKLVSERVYDGQSIQFAGRATALRHLGSGSPTDSPLRRYNRG